MNVKIYSPEPLIQETHASGNTTASFFRVHSERRDDIQFGVRSEDLWNCILDKLGKVQESAIIKVNFANSNLYILYMFIFISFHLPMFFWCIDDRAQWKLCLAS